MLVEEIQLDNFRYIKHEVLKLPEGKTFILLGTNGSGKSTFLYALPFCFYGHSDWKLEDTIRWGSSKGSVTVIFKIRGNRYKAVRSFTKRSSSFDMFQEVNGKWKDIGGGLNNQASQAFKKIFPVPKEVFLQVICKIQTDDPKYTLGAFCNATSKGMYDIIKEFLDVALVERLETTNKEILNNLSKDVIRLESKKESSENLIDNISHIPLEPYKDKLEQLEIDKEILQGSYDIACEYETNMSNYESAQKFIKQYSDIKKWYDRWQPLKSLEEPTALYDKEELSKKENLMESKEKKVSKLKKDKVETEINLDKAMDDLEVMNKSNNELNNKVSNIEHTISLYEEGKCPTCERRFRNTDDRIEELRNEIEELEETHTSDKELKAQRQHIRDLKSTFNKISKRIYDLNTEINDIATLIGAMTNNKEKTENWNKKLAFLQEYPYDDSPDNIYRKYSNALEVEKPEKEVEEKAAVIKEKLDKVEKDYIKYTKELEEAKHNNKMLETHATIIRQCEEELEQVATDYEQHKKLSKLYSRTGAPHLMIRDFLSNLQLYANQYLKKFTNDRFSVEFKTTQQGRNNIELILYDSERGNKPRPYSTLSRGEKTRIALSIEVLGMGKAFTTLSGIEVKTCLMDEVYGLDEEGQREFAEILTEMSGARPVMGGVVCFESMATNFENIIKIENGKIAR